MAEPRARIELDPAPEAGDTVAPEGAAVRLIRAVRSAARVAVLAVIVPGGYLLLLAGRLALAPLPRARVRFSAAFFRHWARLALAILRLRVEVAGAAPRPPLLLVSNHLSYLDVLVLASHLRCVFVAKADVADWPLFGRICRTLGTIFIDRGQRRDIPRVLAEIEQALQRGVGVVFFPEGTSSKGETVEPFKSPLLALASRLGLPVHWAALGYRTPPGEPPAHHALCWWGGVSFLAHVVRVLGLSAGVATIRFGPEPIAEADRKLLAERLREAVLARFEPVVERPGRC